MKTGRVVISKENSKGELLQKRFNFELKSSVEYLTVLNAVRGVVKSTYNIEVLGGIKHPKKYPVLTLEELLIEVSKVRFTDIQKYSVLVYDEELIGTIGYHVPCVACASVNKGEVYHFFKIELSDCDLVTLDYDQIERDLGRMGLDLAIAESGFYYIPDKHIRPELEITAGYYNLVLNVYKEVGHLEDRTRTINL